jgi:hypothetical protein
MTQSRSRAAIDASKALESCRHPPAEEMHLHRFLLVAGLGLGLNGCSTDSNLPPIYQVTGIVTLKGQPVEGAVVVFTPLPGADSAPLTRGGQAQTDADGKFSIESTFDQGITTQLGLPAGEYRVTVIKMQAPPGPPSLNRPPKNVLPAEFAAVESTPLSATIKADGPNDLKISL